MNSPGIPRSSNEVLTVSNCISFLRILLAIPTCYALYRNEFQVTAVLMVVAYITDILDGFVARKSKTVTEFGKALDPIADKLFVVALLVVMLSKGLVPFWFVATVVAKDLATMIGSMIASKKLDTILPSNYWGKSAILLTIICLFLSVSGVSHDVLVFGWIVAATLLIISFIIYFVRALRLIKSAS